MIKYNSNTINDWNFGDDNIIKVYRDGVVVYYKVITSGSTPEYKVCYAVVDDISQYSETEYEDVFDKATEKWYKLNNLNQYEEYGVYASGRTSCSGSSRLPQGYTEVEYVGNSGTSYINTGVYLNTSNFEVGYKCDGQYALWGYVHQMVVDGAWVTVMSDYAYFGKYNNNNKVAISSYLSSVENTIKYTQSGITIINDDTNVVLQKNLSLSNIDNLGTVPVPLFTTWDFYSRNFDFFGSTAKIKSFYIKNNGVTVRDFVPAKRDSDSKYGLYDLITDTFYISPNGEDFSGGEPVTPTDCVTTYEGKLTIDDGYEYIYSGNSWVNVGEVSGSSRLPAGYTEVEYITAENLASGITGPYIDTNFTPNQNTRVVLDYQAIVNGQNNRRIFGSGRFNNTSSGNYIWSMENRIGQSNCYYYYKFDNGSSWKTSTLHPDLNRHVVDFNKEGKIWLDDTAVITLPSTSFTCSYNLGLFNEIGPAMTQETVYEYFQGRVYSCQVYDNGTLVRDLVPCTNPSNVVGMYDLVNNVFYTTANQSYQFEAGSSVAPPIVLPINYDEKSAPLDNLSFSSMTEAQAYAYNSCVYDGMRAIIDGDRYYFDSSDENGWVENESRLPQGYTEVEYIENTTNAYLNLDVYLNTSNFEIGYNILGNWIKWGYTHQGNGSGTWITVESSTAFFGDFNNGRVSIATDNAENVVTFASTSGITVNGVSYSKTFKLGNDSIASIPLYVFGRYDFRSKSVDSGSNVKLKSFYLKNDSTLVRDLVPCIRDNDSMVGMYDLVNDVFYYPPNYQSYQLVAGPVV